MIAEPITLTTVVDIFLNPAGADLSSDQLARFQARLDQATQGTAATGNDDR